mmetsp:Transcript_9090/g.18320  ORF Transcript_9090/g.18320 Transcript_9090/m.18320 type:complete len:241 (-) Transcript_9090:31-753(-)
MISKKCTKIDQSLLFSTGQYDMIPSMCAVVTRHRTIMLIANNTKSQLVLPTILAIHAIAAIATFESVIRTTLFPASRALHYITAPNALSNAAFRTNRWRGARLAEPFVAYRTRKASIVILIFLRAECIVTRTTPMTNSASTLLRRFVVVVFGWTTRIVATDTTSPSRNVFVKQCIALGARFPFGIETISNAFPKLMTLTKPSDDSSFFASRREYHPLKGERSVMVLCSLRDVHSDIILPR